ncbi:MAG: hypothetical protein JF595_05335 [Sphingomonadales bacterium]|nr:hypothetical protein [Sphingomonadales bacterium]
MPAPHSLDRELKHSMDKRLDVNDKDYVMFGKSDGRGIAIRSEEPVDFHPLRNTSNLVCVPSLDAATRFISVATQTIGGYPFDHMPDRRDKLASGGAQRIVPLGEAGPSAIGNLHDAMYPLHRFVHWMAHEDGRGDW